jgi:hypothetical protein
MLGFSNCKVEPVMIVPIHRERQIMQYLRNGGWVGAGALPGGESLIDSLLKRGWIEQGILAGDICYRMTPIGLDAKRARIPTGQDTVGHQTNLLEI